MDQRTDPRPRSSARSSEERVMLFMKGTPDMPRCGFSARIVADPQRERRRVRGDGHPARPAHPRGAVRAVGLAHDPAAVRRRRAGRRLRHRHRDVRVRRAGRDARRRAAADARRRGPPQPRRRRRRCRSSSAVDRRARPSCRATSATTRSSRRTPRCPGWRSAWSGSGTRSRAARRARVSAARFERAGPRRTAAAIPAGAAAAAVLVAAGRPTQLEALDIVLRDPRQRPDRLPLDPRRRGDLPVLALGRAARRVVARTRGGLRRAAKPL